MTAGSQEGQPVNEERIARDKARADSLASLRAQHYEDEQARNRARFFDEHGSPIDLPTVMEAFARAIDRRLGVLELQKDAVEEVRVAVEENTKTTEKLAADCAPMIEFAKAVSGFTKTMKYVSEFAKPVGWTIFGISALVIFLIAAWHSVWDGTPIPTKK